MRTRIVAVVAFGLVVAACGGTSEVAETRPRTTTPITTTIVVPATTQPMVTTSTAPGAPTTTLPVPEVSAELAMVRVAMKKAEFEPPARVEGLIEIAGTDAALGYIDVSLPFSTSHDSVTGDGHMLMDFSSLAGLLGGGDGGELAGVFDRMEVRQIGDTAYVNFGLFNLLFGVETPWLSMPVEDGQGFTQEFSSGVDPYNPTGYLKALGASGGDVTVIGTESLRGVATTHYRAIFDLETLARIDPAAFSELQESAPVGLDDLPLDIWIDDANRVHRFVFELDGPALGEAQAGESFDYMRVQFDFSDYGGRVTVEPPPADDVTDVSEIEDWFMGGLGEFDA